jgi:3-hydroxy-9,10-secoandrosta-1,3,5(10)-triene-9,17-dione monooxygenase reductase component
VGTESRAVTAIDADAPVATQLQGRDRFRHVLSHVPTGVVVVAGHDGTAPAGLAIGSFTSISLDPPLVGFYPDRASTSWPVIRRAGRFCVNVLAAHQAGICRRFARSGGDKFMGITWRPAAQSGGPILDGVVAWIDCELEREIELGDHSLVVGRVLDLGLERPAPPLIFLRGGHPALARP